MTAYSVSFGQLAQPEDLNQLVAIVNSLNSAATDANISSDGTGVQTYTGAKINPAAVTQAGSTSGTMTLYQPLQGIVKLAVIVFVNFRNNGGATQGLVLPVPFVGRSKMWGGDLPSVGISFQASSVSRSVAVITALAAGGGSASNLTVVLSKSQGEILGGWDTMIVPSGASAVNDGVVVILGT